MKLYGRSTESKSNRSRLRRWVAAICAPWPVTPIHLSRPSSRASSAASSAPPGLSAWSHSIGSARAWICHRSTWSTSSRSRDRWISSRAPFSSRLSPFVARKKRPGSRLSQGAMRSSESPYPEAVSMWLTPYLSRTSRFWSATRCETPPREAAPKMNLVLLWPVRPNSALGITYPKLAPQSTPGAMRYGEASIQLKPGGANGVFQPEDQAESRDSGQRAQEEAQRAHDERRQAPGAVCRDRRVAGGRKAAAAVQVHQQGTLRQPGRARAKVAAWLGHAPGSDHRNVRLRKVFGYRSALSAWLQGDRHRLEPGLGGPAGSRRPC